jgi:hypothetical protein
MNYDNDEQRAEAQRNALIEEDRHYANIKRVFGTADGLDVLEWLLTDLCGYWRSRFDTEGERGKFELGRFIFNQVCVADIDICHALLERRRKQAEAVRNEERRRIEKGRE